MADINIGSDQSSRPSQPPANGSVPTVVVDNVHVKYKILQGGAGAGSAVAAFKRVLSRQQAAVKTEIHAVKGVSLVACQGEAIGVIGTNGSGKSTLLRTIAGLLPPTSGTVYTKGQPSLLGVNAALMNNLSGERNVLLGCLAMGMSLAQARAQCQEIIDFSGINERRNFSALPMRTYSSGMAARLRFSIAAAKKHEVLLIDEALATGDAPFRRRSEERVRELRANAGTVFLVSHSNSSIKDTCERTIWLESGEIRMDGPTSEVLAAYDEFSKAR